MFPKLEYVMHDSFLEINFLAGENEISSTDLIYKTISHHAFNLGTLPVQ
jgi:hypothetical protein